MKETYWEKIKDTKRIVVKVGSSSLIYPETGNINYARLEKLVRTLVDIKNSGKDVVLVSSGAIAVGREILKMGRKPKTMAEKQACASVGQCELMAKYNRLFLEYGQISSQVLMTTYSIREEKPYHNLENTLNQLLKCGVIPIVNENDTISTDEIEFGENDTLSGIVAAIVDADLVVILSDIDGLYTDDPSKNKNAKLIHLVTDNREGLKNMAKTTSDSDVGTGGMFSKVTAANLMNNVGINMIITNGNTPNNIIKILDGKEEGTLFTALQKRKSNIREYLVENINKGEI